jgi:hypothetical protein
MGENDERMAGTRSEKAEFGLEDSEERFSISDQLDIHIWDRQFEVDRL